MIAWLKALLSNSFVPIVIVAAIVIFLETFTFFRGTNIGKIRERLIPVFIILICINSSLTSIDLSNIESMLESRINTNIETLKSTTKFDIYFEDILGKAQTVKIIHIGDFIPTMSRDGEYKCDSERNELDNRTYLKTLEKFVNEEPNSGIRLIRVSSIPNNKKVKDWLRCDVKKYGDTYQLRLIPIQAAEVEDKSIRTNGIILVDQGETKIVILASPHKDSDFNFPMLAVSNSKIYRFYEEYFNYLSGNTVTNKYLDG